MQSAYAKAQRNGDNSAQELGAEHAGKPYWAAIGVNTGTQVKPAQNMTGSLEPTGPRGHTCIIVARADIIREY